MKASFSFLSSARKPFKSILFVATRFAGQPVQGFSGIQFGENGSYCVMPDNGYGAKFNSIDFNLRLYNISL